MAFSLFVHTVSLWLHPSGKIFVSPYVCGVDPNGRGGPKKDSANFGNSYEELSFYIIFKLVLFDIGGSLRHILLHNSNM